MIELTNKEGHDFLVNPAFISHVYRTSNQSSTIVMQDGKMLEAQHTVIVILWRINALKV